MENRPPLSDRLSLNDPLFISLISLSRNDPHFENALSLNDHLSFGNKCSHWMTPGSQINALHVKWAPFPAKMLSPNDCHFQKYMFSLNDPHFQPKLLSLNAQLFKKWLLSLNDSVFASYFYRPHQMTPYFSGALTERPPFFFTQSVTERPSRCRTSPSLPYLSAPRVITLVLLRYNISTVCCQVRRG